MKILAETDAGTAEEQPGQSRLIHVLTVRVPHFDSLKLSGAFFHLKIVLLMELPENLDLSGVEDIHNDPIHVIMINKEGDRVYGGKMSPAQVAFLDYEVGDKVLLTTVGLPIVVSFYIIKSRKILVKRDTKYEIHLHFDVDTSAPVPPPF